MITVAFAKLRGRLTRAFLSVVRVSVAMKFSVVGKTSSCKQRTLAQFIIRRTEIVIKRDYPSFPPWDFFLDFAELHAEALLSASMQEGVVSVTVRPAQEALPTLPR